MKKITTILVLLFVLSVSVSAGDGDVPIGGGKSCPQGQTCFTEGEIPIAGLTDGEYPTGGRSDNSIYGEIFDFLKSIF